MGGFFVCFFICICIAQIEGDTVKNCKNRCNVAYLRICSIHGLSAGLWFVMMGETVRLMVGCFFLKPYGVTLDEQ